ncbi:hypothetical protein TELCIR_19280, partial [Teladorsagia circumcincta]
LRKWPHLQLIVYSGDYDATKEQILLKAKQRFGITVDPKNELLSKSVLFRLRRLVEADLYPRFTLLLQTLAGFILGVEALLKFNPEVFIDSMGYALTLPLFRFAEDNVLRILSIGQIRPEKNHKMQLEVVRMVMKKLAESNDRTKRFGLYQILLCTHCDEAEAEDLGELGDTWWRFMRDVGPKPLQRRSCGQR